MLKLIVYTTIDSKPYAVLLRRGSFDYTNLRSSDLKEKPDKFQCTLVIDDTHDGRDTYDILRSEVLSQLGPNLASILDNCIVSFSRKFKSIEIYRDVTYFFLEVNSGALHHFRIHPNFAGMFLFPFREIGIFEDSGILLPEDFHAIEKGFSFIEIH